MTHLPRWREPKPHRATRYDEVRSLRRTAILATVMVVATFAVLWWVAWKVRQ